MNIGFVMYDWETIKPELDSTLRLIHEGIKRGHKVSAIYPNEWQLGELLFGPIVMLLQIAILIQIDVFVILLRAAN